MKGTSISNFSALIFRAAGHAFLILVWKVFERGFIHVITTAPPPLSYHFYIQVEKGRPSPRIPGMSYCSSDRFKLMLIRQKYLLQGRRFLKKKCFAGGKGALKV